MACKLANYPLLAIFWSSAFIPIYLTSIIKNLSFGFEKQKAE